MKRSGSLGFLLLLAGAASVAASSLGRAGVSYYNYLGGLTVNASVTAPDGSLVIGGQASSAGLPVTPDALHPAYRGSVCPAAGTPFNAPCPEGYVARFAADGTLLYGTYLPGAAQAAVRNVAADADGTIYAAVTANLALTGAPQPVLQDGATHLYLVAIQPGQSSFSRAFIVDAELQMTVVRLVVDSKGNLYLGGTCTGGCVLSYPADSDTPRYVAHVGTSGTSVTDLAVDDQGNVYLAGATTSSDLAGLDRGWRNIADGPLAGNSSYSFVTVLDPDSKVLWSALFGSPGGGGATQLLRNARGDIAVIAVALADPQSHPFTPDLRLLAQLTVVQFRGDPTHPAYSVDVAPGIQNGSVAAVLDDDDAVLLTGISAYLQPGGVNPPTLPTTPDALDRCVSGAHTRFFLRLAADGHVDYASYFGLDQSSSRTSISLGPDGVLYTSMVGAESMGESGTALAFLSPAKAPDRSRLCAVNGANFRPDALAAGGLISIFGSGLGSSATDTHVFLNGAPVQLIAVTPNQINAWLPEDAPPDAHLDVQSPESSQSFDVQIRPAAPGLFQRANSLAAVADNEDGTPNGPGNPAPRGSVVRIYGTGFGSGGQTPETFIGNRPATVLSAGQQSGGPPGTTELRVQIPDMLPPAFQSVANIQFRQGLYILQTNLFVWIR